jgi:hypothetical protein
MSTRVRIGQLNSSQHRGRRSELTRRIAQRPSAPPDRDPRCGPAGGDGDLEGLQGVLGPGEVIPALRGRELSAVSDLGYQPNYIAQSLRRGGTDLIVASDLSDSSPAEAVAGPKTC